MPLFIAHPEPEFVQLLPDKGFLEPFGHEFFPEQAGDISCSGTSGKKILPFCTNEGSGMGKSEETIKALCPDADVRKGKSIMGGQAKSSKTELEAWVKQNI